MACSSNLVSEFKILSSFPEKSIFKKCFKAHNLHTSVQNHKSNADHWVSEKDRLGCCSKGKRTHWEFSPIAEEHSYKHCSCVCLLRYCMFPFYQFGWSDEFLLPVLQCTHLTEGRWTCFSQRGEQRTHRTIKTIKKGNKVSQLLFSTNTCIYFN